MATTLIVTNDFPPRIGGIESFVRTVCRLLDDDVVVLTSSAPGAVEYDRSLPFRVLRCSAVLLPTRSATRVATELLISSGASRVIFGAAAPLGLMAPALRRAGAVNILGLTHGHEVWWSKVPGARARLRKIAAQVDHLAVISEFTRNQIAAALDEHGKKKLIRLSPPVDGDVFRPSGRRRSGPPRCIAVGRFVSQKGFSTLLHAWSMLIKNWPGERPELIMVGDGPERNRLRRLAAAAKVHDSVHFTGALGVPAVVDQLQQATVFALPVRTRLAGLNPEGLGLAFLEAAACGLPVIVGGSGGAPETVIDQQTGFVVDSRDPDTLAARMTGLLRDPARAAKMGEAGREFVLSRYGLPVAQTTLSSALAL